MQPVYRVICKSSLDQPISNFLLVYSFCNIIVLIFKSLYFVLNKNRKNKIFCVFFMCEQLYVSVIFFKKLLQSQILKGIRVRVRFSSARKLAYTKLGLIQKKSKKKKISKLGEKNFLYSKLGEKFSILKVRGKNFSKIF